MNRIVALPVALQAPGQNRLGGRCRRGAGAAASGPDAKLARQRLSLGGMLSGFFD
jgi:hypothetical protein